MFIFVCIYLKQNCLCAARSSQKCLELEKCKKIESWREHNPLDSPHYFPTKAKYA
jgi:hypothetical protein